MQITKKKICWRKGGTTYSAHLHSGSFAYADYSMKLRVGNETLLCPMIQGSQANSLCVAKQMKTSVNTFHAIDIVPVAEISWIAGGSIIGQHNFDTTLKTAINNAIELIGISTNASETVIGTLPAGSNTMSQTSVPTLVSLAIKIRIGSWESSAVAVGTTAGSVSIDIPEAQWGV